MSMQYGIAVTNKYEFLDEGDADLSELITAPTKADKDAKKKDKKLQRKTKEAQAIAPVAPAPTPAAKKPVSKPPTGQDVRPGDLSARKERDDKENKPRPMGGGQPRGGRGDARGGFAPRGDRPPRGTGPGGPRRGGSAQFQENLPPRFANGEEQRGGFTPRFEGDGEFRGRGMGRGRGRGAPRGAPRGGPRGGFDRPSGGEGGFTEAMNVGDSPKMENWPADASVDERTFGTFGEEEGERASGARFPRGGGRGRGMPGRRGGFGPGRGRGFGPRGRQFERQSGSDKTGVKQVDKRDGGGAHNWGTANDELAGETDPLNVTASGDELGGEGGEHGGKQRAQGEEEKVEPTEPAVHELTLEEYYKMQQQQEQAAKKPKFAIRKAGDGEDSSVWTNLAPLHRDEPAKKKEDEEDLTEFEQEDEHRSKKKDLTAQIRIELSTDQSRGGGALAFGPRGTGGFRGGDRRGFGGGGRGGPSPRRGGPPRGAGGYRGGRRGDVPSLDEDSFPQLTPAAT